MVREEIYNYKILMKLVTDFLLKLSLKVEWKIIQKMTSKWVAINWKNGGLKIDQKLTENDPL
jgi:hypothetical protein